MRRGLRRVRLQGGGFRSLRFRDQRSGILAEPGGRHIAPAGGCRPRRAWSHRHLPTYSVWGCRQPHPECHNNTTTRYSGWRCAGPGRFVVPSHRTRAIAFLSRSLSLSLSLSPSLSPSLPHFTHKPSERVFLIYICAPHMTHAPWRFVVPWRSSQYTVHRGTLLIRNRPWRCVEPWRCATRRRPSTRASTARSAAPPAPPWSMSPSAIIPRKPLCGGIPGSFLEPLVRSWSHFVGIYRQN